MYCCARGRWPLRLRGRSWGRSLRAEDREDGPPVPPRRRTSLRSRSSLPSVLRAPSRRFQRGSPLRLERRTTRPPVIVPPRPRPRLASRAIQAPRVASLRRWIRRWIRRGTRRPRRRFPPLRLLRPRLLLPLAAPRRRRGAALPRLIVASSGTGTGSALALRGPRRLAFVPPPLQFVRPSGGPTSGRSGAFSRRRILSAGEAISALPSRPLAVLVLVLAVRIVLFASEGDDRGDGDAATTAAAGDCGAGG